MKEFNPRILYLLQSCLSYLSFSIVAPFIYIYVFVYKRSTVSNIREIRAQYKKLIKTHKGPLLVCPNHLTYVDSLILAIVLGSYGHYLRYYRSLCWNLPSLKNIRQNWWYRVLCYLAKCQTLDRQSSSENMKNTLEKVTELLRANSWLTIFIEGTRSRSGRVNPENCMYGVGQFLLQFPNLKVLAVYSRAYSQKTSSKFPPLGEEFYFQMELMTPQTPYYGMRGARELSMQIMNKLVEMENEFFKN